MDNFFLKLAEIGVDDNEMWENIKENKINSGLIRIIEEEIPENLSIDQSEFVKIAFIALYYIKYKKEDDFSSFMSLIKCNDLCRYVFMANFDIIKNRLPSIITHMKDLDSFKIIEHTIYILYVNKKIDVEYIKIIIASVEKNKLLSLSIFNLIPTFASHNEMNHG